MELCEKSQFLITDTTAMNGSANFTQASADRASEVATFFSDPRLVHELRCWLRCGVLAGRLRRGLSSRPKPVSPAPRRPQF
jgi:phosphatidylserine/phosphatidylglycerophosphate/cardiolipin synthase-like enzyme